MNDSDTVGDDEVSVPLVSVVTTAWNEEENIEPFLDAVIQAVLEENVELEIVVVDNGSTDRTLPILRERNKLDARVQFVSLSRNFGYQGGLIAGLEVCRGDVVVTLDADLQHPPVMIRALLARWREGNLVVNTRRDHAPENSWIRIQLDRLFYFAIDRMSGIPISESQSDFRLLDRQALDVLLQLPEREKFIRGLVHWIGFSNASVSYEVAPRHAGQSKFKMGQLLRLGIGGVTSFSLIPLRVYMGMGLILAIGSIGYGLVILISAILSPSFAPPGWVSLILGILFLGGIQLMGIGILGEYLGRVLDETRGRPPYIIKGSSINDSQ